MTDDEKKLGKGSKAADLVKASGGEQAGAAKKEKSETAKSDQVDDADGETGKSTETEKATEKATAPAKSPSKTPTQTSRKTGDAEARGRSDRDHEEEDGEDEEDDEEDDDDDYDEEEEDDEEEDRERSRRATRRRGDDDSDDWLPDWAPWAVLIGLVVLGLLGGFGFLSSPKSPPSSTSSASAESESAATEKPEPTVRKVDLRPNSPSAKLADEERIEAAHLLVQYKGSMRAAADVARTKEEARARAGQALAEVKKGTPFEKVVGNYSDEPGAAQRGGKLGRFGRRSMVKQFSEAAFALKPGEISGIVETPFGFHVIHRTQ